MCLRAPFPGGTLSVILITILATAVQADQSPPSQTLKDLTLEQLSQIEVTSPSKAPAPEARSPVAVYVITAEDIRRAGVTTIPEALRLAPGVEVARIDGSKWSVGIRGFGTQLTRDVLVLIDGRSVYTPLFAGTYWQVQDTLLEDIDRIEIIRGPGGTIWGPNAVDGVINIITKRASETQGTYASVGGGSEEEGFFNFRYGGDNGKGLSYRMYAKGYTRGPEYHFDGDNFDDWRGVQGGFRMDWGSGRDAFTLQGDAYSQEDGERAALSTYTPPNNETLDGDAEYSGGNVLFKWKRKFSEGNDFQLQAYYDRTNHQEVNFGEDRDTFDVDILKRNKLSPRHELSYGVGANASDGRFDEVGSGLVFYPFNRLDYLFSGFVQDEITLVNNRLVLTAGSKILRTNFTGFVFEPSVRLMWTPTDRMSFWAAYTHAVRTPSDAEEDFYLSSVIGTVNGMPAFARFNPNPNFASEQLNGYELGYRQLITRNFYVDVAGFANHYHDLFSEDITGAPYLESTLPFPTSVAPPLHYLLPAQFRNDLYGFTKGGEIAPEWRPTQRWRLRGSYSYLQMDLKQAASLVVGAGPASVVGSSPRHEVTVDSGFDLTRKLQVDLYYRYVSALPAVSAPDYSTGDARFAWRVLRRLEFSVVGRNLFQPYHVEYAADPGPPVAIRRSVYASLAWTAQ